MSEGPRALCLLRYLQQWQSAPGVPVPGNLVLDKVVESTLPERVDYVGEGRSTAGSSSLPASKGSAPMVLLANLMIEEPDALIAHVRI
jgi:hypothetical protein